MKANPFRELEELYGDPATREIRRQMVTWMESVLAWVDNTLLENPPAWPEPAIRRRALFMLDEPLHVLSAPLEPSLNDFLNRRIERAVEEIEDERVTSGVTIWKLYNHGFVMKTPDLTIGFDLHRGPFETFQVDADLFDRLLDQVQALFVSHAHSDHADATALARMVALGRPVIVPPGVGEGEELDRRLVRPGRHWTIENRLSLKNAVITYRVFPGHQGRELINNVYVVGLPGGIQLMQTGDQSNADDFVRWIDRAHQYATVDILLPNCWSTDLPRLIKGVDPRLVITGHENEMSHPVDHREAFSKTYGHVAKEETPVVVMAWGERYHYDPDQALPTTDSADDAGEEGDLTGLQTYLSKF